MGYLFEKSCPKLAFKSSEFSVNVIDICVLRYATLHHLGITLKYEASKITLFSEKDNFMSIPKINTQTTFLDLNS